MLVGAVAVSITWPFLVTTHPCASTISSGVGLIFCVLLPKLEILFCSGLVVTKSTATASPSIA